MYLRMKTWEKQEKGGSLIVFREISPRFQTLTNEKCLELISIRALAFAEFIPTYISAKMSLKIKPQIEKQTHLSLFTSMTDLGWHCQP